MISGRLGMAHVRGALLVVFAASQLVGCLSHLRDGGDALGDGGTAGCGGGPDCTSGNHCYCGRCISLDLAPGACDPSCAAAMHGDLCTEEGRVCAIGACRSLVCTSGSFVTRTDDVCDAGASPDAGVAPDVGWCECPAPPPGCVYDGSPCVCSHLTCPTELCGRDVCSPGTTCCNASCGVCVPAGGGCDDLWCAPDCTAQDARSGGRCAGSVGWAWDGTACREIACRCEGTECDAIYPTRSACDAYFSACPAVDCSEDDARGDGECATLIGYVFTSRGCLPIVACGCTGTDCAAVAGRTEAACSDAHAGCPILFP